jgi:hypothetical protein
MDGSHWVAFIVDAKGTHRTFAATTVRPSIRLFCEVDAKKEATVELFLQVGIVDAVSPTMCSRETCGEGYGEFAGFRIRLGDSAPVWSYWKQLPDHVQYRYFHSHHFKNDEDLDISTLDEVQALMAAKSVLVEFRPFRSASTVVAAFDVRGLKPEFDKHAECTKALIPSGQQGAGNFVLNSGAGTGIDVSQAALGDTGPPLVQSSAMTFPGMAEGGKQAP